MAEAKKKPPRPPPPSKLKKSGKSQPSAGMYSMRFNPNAADDIDDELIDTGDPSRISFTKNTSKTSTDSASLERPNSLPERHVPSITGKSAKQSVPNRSSPTLSSSPLSRNSSVTSTSPKDDPLHSLLDAQDPHDDHFLNSDSRSVKEKRSKESIRKAEETGVVKVQSEVLSTDTGNDRFEPNDGMDPLTLFSQMLETKGSTDTLGDLDDQDHEGDLKRDVTGDRADAGNGKDGQDEIEDFIEVNQYHYNHPTPDELDDQPVVSPSKEKRGKMSFRDLQESATDMQDEPDGPTDREWWQSRSDEGESTKEKKRSVKPPKEMKPISSLKEDKQDSGEPGISESNVSSIQRTLPEEAVEPLPPVWLLSAITTLLFVSWVFPVPVFIEGLVAGILVSFYASLGLIWFNLPPRWQRFDGEPLDDSTPLAVTGERMSVDKVKQKVQEQKVCEVWMNELSSEYDQDTYHISQTQSVFIRLEQHTLRLSTPRHNISRRSMWSDPVAPKAEFVHQRIYDLQGGKVKLLPDGIVNKRLWSKKYPIQIELPSKGTQETREKVKTAFNDEQGVDEDDGFVVIKDEECDDRTLTFFARTGREKEEWFWRFEVAVNYESNKGRKPIPTLYKRVSFNNGKYLDEEGNLHHVRSETFDPLAKKGMVDFYKFIAKVLPREKDLREPAPLPPVNAKADSGVTYASPAPRLRRPEESIGMTLDTPLAWANAIVGRVFWDFLREENWAEIIQAKLQKKLDKLRIPRFIEGLKITDTDLGVNAPTIKRTLPPRIDSRGVWVYLDISYQGSCCITLTTKFNPWKLRLGGDNDNDEEQGEMEEEAAALGNTENQPKKRSESTSAALDSEEEDSAESSDEEPTEENLSEAGNKPDEGVASRASGKFMHYVNRAANSKLFKRATENKYVKRAFDEVSNTPVELTVEVKDLRGTMALNIPPPPTDRLWYGFVEKPNLWLSAKPKLGAKQISLSRVTDYIEKKLDLEFQKVFVLPNMDDVVIPIMLFDLENERL